MSLLLSGTVLAWSLSPPAVQHAHEGGTDLCHHHGCADTDRDEGDGAHLSRHASDCRQTHSAAVVPNAIAGQASHLHFEWLGFRLTLPDTDSPSKKGEDRSASKLLFVQASRDSVPQVYSGTRLDRSLTLLSPQAVSADITAACPAVSCSLLPVIPHPLCDRARHERSGVQLA